MISERKQRLKYLIGDYLSSCLAWFVINCIRFEYGMVTGYSELGDFLLSRMVLAGKPADRRHEQAEPEDGSPAPEVGEGSVAALVATFSLARKNRCGACPLVPWTKGAGQKEPSPMVKGTVPDGRKEPSPMVADGRGAGQKEPSPMVGRECASRPLVTVPFMLI